MESTSVAALHMTLIVYGGLLKFIQQKYYHNHTTTVVLYMVLLIIEP